MALELRKRRKSEPGQQFIRRVEPGQNPVKATQYEILLNSYRINRALPGCDPKTVPGECLGCSDETPVEFRCG